MKTLNIIILGGLIALFTYAMGVLGGRELWRQHQAESFPHVQGLVRTSETTTTRGSKGRINYHPYIAYRYSVDGTNYAGCRYRYDACPNDQESVNEIVAAHPAGSPVDVYYNPQDPLDAVLSTTVVAQDVAPPFIFTPASLLILWSLIITIKQSDSGKPPVAGGVKIIKR
jgi:hypothetical protein